MGDSETADRPRIPCTSFPAARTHARIGSTGPAITRTHFPFPRTVRTPTRIARRVFRVASATTRTRQRTARTRKQIGLTAPRIGLTGRKIARTAPRF
jgi:hypothetical protein